MSEQLNHLNVINQQANRLTYEAANTAVLEKCQVADLKEKSVIVKTLYSGISRGTESLVYNGKVPITEQTTMRCPYQVGEFSFPLSYGYACIGEIIEIQSDTKRLKEGDIVFVLHPHQDIFCVSEDACNLVPDMLPPSRGVLSANMETALNAVWDAELKDTKNHLVIGAGVVGLLTAFCIREISNQSPIIVDVNPDKQKVAQKLGLTCLTPDAFLKSNPAEMNRIFNTSAASAGLQMAINSAGFEAKIIEMSWYGENQVTLNLGGAFHSKRLQIISSQVGHVSPTKRKTHSYSDRMQEAMKILCDQRLDALLEDGIMFESLPDHLHDIFSANSSALCQLVKYKSK